MVPTFSLGMREFTLAESGSLAAPTPQCPMAFRPGGGLAAVKGYGLRPFPGISSNHDCKQRSRVSAARPRGQHQGFDGGESR
jgi:hypothetical protein